MSNNSNRTNRADRGEVKSLVSLMLVAVLCVAVAVAQVRPSGSVEGSVRPTTFYLSNGLKVIVAEDHAEPKVFGAVVVHAGSKNEDSTATGVAHYFEHIMFKGTDKIGTTDWTRESRYLDSISKAYDELHATEGEAERHAVQLEINRLNIEASKFAIANETDAILQQMGCTELNAGTTYDYTMYFNALPSNQLENWMEVYAERFRNPVYRLFQGELEAVYEERNIYANQAMYTFSRNIFSEGFGEHPYSRDVIGLDEHLKNPQPSAMKKFYDKYYVASNMALVIVGDVNTSEVRAMAEKYFSIWPRGRKMNEPKYALPTFEGREVKTVKQTPIGMGVIVLPGVKQNDRDQLALQMVAELLSGGNGSLDKLVSDGKLMMAAAMPLTLQDAGINAILYVPRLVGQKHEAAEELVWDAIDSIKQGRFSDRLLQSIKTRMAVQRKHQLEDYHSIANLLITLEAEGSNYNQWVADVQHIENMSKAEIMDVASRYFDRERCTIVRSSMGFPKKSAAIKPDWDHLDAQNQGAQSDFARRIAARQVSPIEPQEIEFGRDVIMTPLTHAATLYSAPNPRNDMFTLRIAYHYGSVDDRNVDMMAQYWNLLGAGKSDLQQYTLDMDCLGATFEIETDYDYTTFVITGSEGNFDQIMDLVMLKLHHPRADAQQLKNIIDGMEASKRAAKDDADTWASALKNYVLYGDRSPYLNQTTIKEAKRLGSDQLIGMVEQLYKRDGYVTFVGNLSPERVASRLLKENLVHEQVTSVPQRMLTPSLPTEDKVYYSTNSKFLKSDISLYIPSRDFDYTADRAAAAMFNEYMGGGMNSVFFQEIREFRALGYHTYGYFGYDPLGRFRPYYMSFLATQCDKSLDGIAALRELMLVFPERPAKFRPSQEYLIASRNSSYISFRNMPEQVRMWREVMKLDADPRSQITSEIRTLHMDALEDFHKKYVAGRPMTIIINGNAKQFKSKELKQYGKVKQVKFGDMIRF